MSEWAWGAIATETMALAALAATAITRQTRFTFLFGFNVMLPVALVHLLGDGPVTWRSAAVLVSVLLYLANMNVVILLWSRNTALSKLDDSLSPAARYLLPFVMTNAAGWLYCLPFHYVAQRTGPFDWQDALALAAYVVGSALHFAADLQKRRFKARPGTRGQLLDEGLWRWSRHPNYFGDVLLYVGWALAAGAPWAWLCPAANLFQYAFDAIPKNERWAAGRYGDAWTAYAARTSVFVPWPPRGA